jgi:precorrin-6B methylase 2
MVSESRPRSTVGVQLAQAEHMLAAAGVATPRAEALELLSAVLGVPVALFAARDRARLSAAAADTYLSWVERRAAGEAIAHITGHLAFMELDLVVDRATPLVPRYGARLVEVALECARRARQYDLLAAELGTGCGAIALALAAFEPRFARIYALDSSPETLRVASANGARYLLNLVVSWLPGAGLDTLSERVDLIVHARCGSADSAWFVELLERAPAKLRAGGTLVCGLDREQAEPAEAAVLRALPDAQVWTEAHSDGTVVVAQVPRPLMTDAALEMEG